MISRKLQTRAGFSLVESLLVLTIITLVMIAFQTIPSRDLHHYLEVNFFFSHLKSQLIFGQEKAMTRLEPIRVSFHKDLNQIYFAAQSHLYPYQILDLPADLELASNFEFIFTPTGRTNAFKTVIFNDLTKQEAYYLKFQLGSGRFVLSQ